MAGGIHIVRRAVASAAVEVHTVPRRRSRVNRGLKLLKLNLATMLDDKSLQNSGLQMLTSHKDGNLSDAAQLSRAAKSYFDGLDQNTRENVLAGVRQVTQELSSRGVFRYDGSSGKMLLAAPAFYHNRALRVTLVSFDGHLKLQSMVSLVDDDQNLTFVFDEAISASVLLGLLRLLET